MEDFRLLAKINLTYSLFLITYYLNYCLSHRAINNNLHNGCKINYKTSLLLLQKAKEGGRELRVSAHFLQYRKHRSYTVKNFDYIAVQKYTA